MSQLAHEAATDADLYQGLYRMLLSPNLHQRQMRAAYVGVYQQARKMGLAEVAARAHAARAERKIDADIKAGRRPPIQAMRRDDETNGRVFTR